MMSLTRLVAPALGLASLVHLAAALPALEPRATAAAAPSAWIDVDAQGNGVTVVPTVTTVNGAVSTLSAPPSALTQTGTYTLYPGSATTTVTGLPPVASATGTGDAGQVLTCNQYQSADGPFCQPRGGAQLAPGKTYYITWNPGYFENVNATIQVQGDYDDNTGFASVNTPNSHGFYPWTIPSDFLTRQSRSSVNVTLYLAYYNPADNDVDILESRIPGPHVYITNAAPDASTGGGGVSAVVIALPIVLGLLVLGTVAHCFWSYRKTGTLPIIGRFLGSGGYGTRQSKSQRSSTATASTMRDDKVKPHVDIQLTDRDSWPSSPTQAAGQQQSPSRNVFREEMARQARET